MVLAPRRWRAGELLEPVEPGPRSKWWIEALVIMWLCWIYDLVSNLAPLRNTAARHHAESTLHLERVLHLDPEAAMNHWLAAHHTLGLLAGDYYDNAHFVVTLGVVGWLWWRYPSSYRPLRNGLVITNLIAFAVFWRYPMAPPRMLPGHQYIDIVAASGAFGSSHSGTLATVSNELAAMPSLHMAWAVWSAWAVFVVWRRRRWIWLVWCYPVLTTLDVLSTGNHFVADVAAGALTAVVAIALGSLLARAWQVWRAGIRARAGEAGQAGVAGVGVAGAGLAGVAGAEVAGAGVAGEEGAGLAGEGRELAWPEEAAWEAAGWDGAPAEQRGAGRA